MDSAKELEPELRFQLSDRFTHGRLSDMQRRCGLGHALRIDDGAKNVK